MAVLPFASRVLLRLAHLPHPSHGLPALLTQAMACLEHLEITHDLRPIAISPPPGTHGTQKRAMLPFRSNQIHEANPAAGTIWEWGEIIEILWQVSMTFEEKPKSWDSLTSRLLIWRGVVGSQRCEMGEWARREVIANLNQD